MFVIWLHLFNIARICQEKTALKGKDRLRYLVFKLYSVLKEKCQNYLNILFKIASKTGIEQEKAKSKNPQEQNLCFKWKAKSAELFEKNTVSVSHCTNTTVLITTFTCHCYQITCAADP